MSGSLQRLRIHDLSQSSHPQGHWFSGKQRWKRMTGSRRSESLWGSRKGTGTRQWVPEGKLELILEKQEELVRWEGQLGRVVIGRSRRHIGTKIWDHEEFGEKRGSKNGHHQVTIYPELYPVGQCFPTFINSSWIHIKEKGNSREVVRVSFISETCMCLRSTFESVYVCVSVVCTYICMPVLTTEFYDKKKKSWRTSTGGWKCHWYLLRGMTWLDFHLSTVILAAVGRMDFSGWSAAWWPSARAAFQ